MILNKFLVSKNEWRWLLIWSALIVIVISLPALVGWWQASKDWHYTGQILSPADGNTYLNKMKQGSAKQWLFSIAYTSEPHEPTFLHPYYLLLGHFSRIVGLSLNLTYYLFRTLNNWLLLIVIYLFMAEFWTDRLKRRIGFWLIVFSAGLGWIFVFLNIPTTDIRVPESVTFPTMLTNPHFPLATAVILLSLIFGMRALHHRSWKYAVLSGLSQSILLLVHPYDIVIIGTVLIGYFIFNWVVYRQWSWKTAGYLVLTWLVALPAFVHNFNLYMSEGVWRLWQTQSPPPTPPLINFLLGYGFLLVLAIVGGYSLFKKEDVKEDVLLQTYRTQMLVIWVISIFILMFAPIPPLEAIQVRFSEGLHIPIAMLATEGLFVISAKKLGTTVPKQKIWVPLLIFLSLTNWLILASSIWRMTIPESPWFYTQDDVAAMQWLDQHGHSEDVVLSLDWTGNYLPAQANVHVYVGHLYETISFAEKVEHANAFFLNKLSEAGAINFLQENNITWIFVGYQELQTSFQPNGKSYLIKAFQQGETIIYRVELP